MAHTENQSQLLRSEQPIGSAAGPDFRPDAYPSLFTLAAEQQHRHGSSEAEESTLQTFPV